MQQLLQFLYRYRVFILFLLLEGICSVLLVQNNAYHGSRYFTAANAFTGSMVNASTSVKDYFSLTEKNRILAEENIRLREEIISLRDSAYMANLELDTTIQSIKAKVIDNSLRYRNNYLIVNKGSEDGLESGMGVIGPDGIIGQVQSVSKRYSTILSLLHSKTIISAKHGPTGTLSSVVWNGKDPAFANLNYLPRHIRVTAGDSIWTSGFNSIFPENTLIGTVEQVDITSDATFYNIAIDLATEFEALSYVYILDLKDKPLIDSLRNINREND